MTIARSEQIDLNATQYYHVMNRCVRRSWLCGFDNTTQKDYSHRKAWIVDRIKYLSNIFAVKICAYAIMSNHYHLVLFVDDKQSIEWSDEEVAERWGFVFKKDAKDNQHSPQKIKLWRERLTSISWFMRCLNEKIARDVNKEDDSGGRFWEGRFKSQALLDEAALLSAMVYVDLNPIRAGIAMSPEESEFTSIYERIQQISKQLKIQKKARSKQQINVDKVDMTNKSLQPANLVPFSDTQANGIQFKLSDYLELVDFTGRLMRADKQVAFIPAYLEPILTRLNLKSNTWVEHVRTLGKQFSLAIGSEVLLINFGQNKKGTRKSLRQSKKVYLA